MKKLLRIMLILFMVLTITTYISYAAEPVMVGMDNIVQQHNQLSIYFSTNLTNSLKTEELSVTLDNHPVKINNIKRFKDNKEGATLLLIADISGSMGNKKLAEEKEILKALVKKSSNNDKFCIATVGSSYIEGAFTSDKSRLINQINSLNSKKENTNIYKGINSALNTLVTNTVVNNKRCVVVISDGGEDNVTGITREEVNTAIEKRRIPVFTVAMLDANPNESKIAVAKILGSFARLSPGGLDLTYGYGKDYSVNNIADMINQKIENSYIIVSDISEFAGIDKQQYLKLEVNIKGVEKVSDGAYIQTTGAKSSSTPITPSTSPSKLPAKSFWDENKLLIIIGLGVLFIVGVALIIALTKRKKKTLLDEVNDNMTIVEDNTDNTIGVNEDYGQTSGNIGPTSYVDVGMERRLKVCLTKMGPNIKNERFEIKVGREFIIGRSAAKSGLSFNNDELLSASHCKLNYVNNNLYIFDLSSTNGTYVNGVPIKDNYKLQNDDVVLIGSMELRVNFD